jgi:hypothetical protein
VRARLREALFHQVSAGAYVLFMGGVAMWVVAMLSPYPILSVIGGFMVGSSLMLGWRESHRKPYVSPLREALGFEVPKPAPERKGKRFCADCGREFVTWKRQDGFNQETGNPHMLITMACPDYDQKADQAARDRWMAAMANTGFMTMGERYESTYGCGKRTTTSLKAVTHNHANKTVSNTCPGCINDMVAEGILSRSTADSMIEMLG